MTQSYDAIVVGGGHNGLVCAAYLAERFDRVLVLERRHLVGGASVTEEVYPGYKYLSLSYVLSLFRPEIIRDLELAKHGYELIPMAYSFSPFPDGRYLLLGAGEKEDAAQIAKFSKHDAEAWPRYNSMVSRLADVLRPMINSAPPDLDKIQPGQLMDLKPVAKQMKGLSRFARSQLVKAMTMSASAWLDEWFESEELKTVFAANGSIGTWGSPSTPGTALVMLHYAIGDVTGEPGTWGLVRGGNGALSEAIASAARQRGAEIRVNAEVARVRTKGGRAVGVTLSTGEEIDAPIVASGADPRRTYLGMLDRSELPPDFVTGMERYRTNGNSSKVNFALKGLPSFTAIPGTGPHLDGDIQLGGATREYLERGFDDFRYGEWSKNLYMDIVIPTLLDPGLAPPGHHVMSAAVKYTPYSLNGGWNDKRKEEFGDQVVETIASFAPGFRDLILHRQVISVQDYEAEYGLTGGNISHGDMAFDQMFSMRPLLGWARYRSPITNLYLCGAGAHPGGGIMGAPGRNAAREIIKDNRLRARR
jgi:phytoene dehydrogenase-like protein